MKYQVQILHLDWHDSLVRVVYLQHGELIHSLAHHNQKYSYTIVNMLNKVKCSELPSLVLERKKKLL